MMISRRSFFELSLPLSYSSRIVPTDRIPNQVLVSVSLDSDDIGGSIRSDAGAVVRRGKRGFADYLPQPTEFHDADAKLPGLSPRELARGRIILALEAVCL